MTPTRCSNRSARRHPRATDVNDGADGCVNTSYEVGVGHDLHEIRTVVRERSREGFVELRYVGDAYAVCAAYACVLGEVGVVQRGLPYIPFGGTLLLGDLAELR